MPPKDMQTIEIRLSPDDSVMNDFEAWLDNEKARLTKIGLTITKVEGTSIVGHFDPSAVDQAAFEN